MDIGKQIKQRKFKSGFEKAYINLLYTTNYFRDLHREVFSKSGILGQHYNILRITRGQYPNVVSPGYIKEVMLDKGRDVTRLLDKLEKMGLIERSVNPLNKRKLDIRLTDKGLNITNQIESELNKLQNKHSLLEEHEYENLSTLLDKLRG
ncbi:MAG: MarR family transcriptional regulator [Saprospiraceae bacterium]